MFIRLLAFPGRTQRGIDRIRYEGCGAPPAWISKTMKAHPERSSGDPAPASAKSENDEQASLVNKALARLPPTPHALSMREWECLDYGKSDKLGISIARSSRASSGAGAYWPGSLRRRFSFLKTTQQQKSLPLDDARAGFFIQIFQRPDSWKTGIIVAVFLFAQASRLGCTMTSAPSEILRWHAPLVGQSMGPLQESWGP